MLRISNQTLIPKVRLAGLSVLVASTTTTFAFPPAPFHTIYGVVRDESGRTLRVDGGIPDAWEQSQLYAAGILPGEDGWDLSLIDRDGDFDKDGISNWLEYIAGTFATDPTDYPSVLHPAEFGR